MTKTRTLTIIAVALLALVASACKPPRWESSATVRSGSCTVHVEWWNRVEVRGYDEYWLSVRYSEACAPAGRKVIVNEAGVRRTTYLQHGTNEQLLFQGYRTDSDGANRGAIIWVPGTDCRMELDYMAKAISRPGC